MPRGSASTLIVSSSFRGVTSAGIIPSNLIIVVLLLFLTAFSFKISFSAIDILSILISQMDRSYQTKYPEALDKERGLIVK